MTHFQPRISAISYHFNVLAVLQLWSVTANQRADLQAALCRLLILCMCFKIEVI